jgi:hypothetical protein
MPSPTTLEFVADLVIRRTLVEVGKGPKLRSALERAYPFPDDHQDYSKVWERALRWHNLTVEDPAIGGGS